MPTICSACKGKCSDQLVLPAGCVLRPTIERVEAVLTLKKVVALWGDRSDGPPTHQIKSFARAISREVVAILADEWLPIEDAPKDGTPLMGCTWIESLPHLYSPRRIFWAAYHPNATGKECWRDAETCGNKLERLTHYRPLLATPAASGIGESGGEAA